MESDRSSEARHPLHPRRDIFNPFVEKSTDISSRGRNPFRISTKDCRNRSGTFDYQRRSRNQHRFRREQSKNYTKYRGFTERRDSQSAPRYRNKPRFERDESGRVVKNAQFVERDDSESPPRKLRSVIVVPLATRRLMDLNRLECDDAEGGSHRSGSGCKSSNSSDSNEDSFRNSEWRQARKRHDDRKPPAKRLRFNSYESGYQTGTSRPDRPVANYSCVFN